MEESLSAGIWSDRDSLASSWSCCGAMQVGTPREELQVEYPDYDFSLLGDGIWWHAGGSSDPQHIELQDMGAL